jgi:hypothetical protein
MCVSGYALSPLADRQHEGQGDGYEEEQDCEGLGVEGHGSMPTCKGFADFFTRRRNVQSTLSRQHALPVVVPELCEIGAEGDCSPASAGEDAESETNGAKHFFKHRLTCV